jgi:hypothetical protein
MQFLRTSDQGEENSEEYDLQNNLDSFVEAPSPFDNPDLQWSIPNDNTIITVESASIKYYLNLELFQRQEGFRALSESFSESLGRVQFKKNIKDVIQQHVQVTVYCI